MKSIKRFCVVLAVMAVVCDVRPVFAAMFVNIDSVVQAFLNNPIRAEQTYMNKEVETEGEVQEIKRDSYGGFMISLKALNTNNFNFYFHCWLAKKTLNTAASLNRGSKIAIRGTVYDFQQRERGIIIEGNIVFLSDSVITRILTRAELEFRQELSRAYNGNVQAQFNVGWKYANGEGVEKNYAESVRWYREAVNKGHALAMNNLGWAYRNGQGVEQNYSEAMRLFRQSAEKGEAWGMISVGQMYEEGLGVSKDISEAVNWYYKAAVKKYDYALERLRVLAENGHAGAMNNLGVLYERGQGVAQNYSEAMKWFRMAADKGQGYGYENLGIMYEHGRGVAKNIDEAMKWYKLAADKGHSNAMFRLAMLYKAKKDYMPYIDYLTQASNKGNKDAVNEYNNNRIAIERLLIVNAIKQEAASSDSAPQSSGRCIINSTNIPLLSLPNARAKVITTLTTGDTVTLVKTFGTWCEIKTSQDLTGWVSGQYITQN